MGSRSTLQALWTFPFGGINCPPSSTWPKPDFWPCDGAPQCSPRLWDWIVEVFGSSILKVLSAFPQSFLFFYFHNRLVFLQHCFESCRFPAQKPTRTSRFPWHHTGLLDLPCRALPKLDSSYWFNLPLTYSTALHHVPSLQGAPYACCHCSTFLHADPLTWNTTP